MTILKDLKKEAEIKRRNVTMLRDEREDKRRNAAMEEK